MVIVDKIVVNYIGNISVKYALGRNSGDNGGGGKETRRQNPWQNRHSILPQGIPIAAER